MNTLKLTASDFASNNVYCGSVDVSDFAGSIVIEPNLGTVVFPKGINVTGSIEAGMHTGISADYGISAAKDISVGYGIRAEGGISAGESISAGYGIYAADDISAAKDISVGYGIRAEGGISAGYGIRAGGGIDAADDINAGRGISAGFGITCKRLDAKKRILAGICPWHELPEEDTLITCTKLVSGTVAFGKLNLLEEKPVEPTCEGEVVVIKGVEYVLTRKKA